MMRAITVRESLAARAINVFLRRLHLRDEAVIASVGARSEAIRKAARRVR
jgi:hypothetical protein